MKLGVIPNYLLYIAIGLPCASATVATLGPSTQTFTLTGIGANSAGQGQSKMSWGTCAFDGTNTNCTLSGPFTGFGGGGTYSFLISYPGNGVFPLNAITAPGSDLFSAASTGNFSLTITLAENAGPTISFYSFANFSFLYNNAQCTGVSPCTVNQVGLTPNATISGPITGTFDPTPFITPSGVITAGNYGGFQVIAPATWIEIYGINLATTREQTWSGADFKGSQAPSSLAGTTVTIAGQPAYVQYVSPGQVNVQVPSGVAAGTQSLVVTTAGGTSASYPVTVKTTEPGMLAPSAFLIRGVQQVVALFSNTLTYVLPIAVPGIQTTRARPGDSITMYGIGFGTVTPNTPAGQIAASTTALQGTVQVSFAGTPAIVTYAGLAPGFVGLYQFNVTVPNVAAGDAVPLTISQGGVNLPQTLAIAVQQ